MKKTLFVASLLMFGLVSQTQAVSVNSNQGTKTGKTDSQTETASGNQTGNAVKTDEKNAVANQGESSQIQTEEQNAVETKDSGKGVDSEKSAANPSEQRRSEVANAVQAMLQIADREGGIGQQVRTIAQTQTQNQTKLEQNIDKIQSRSKISGFFVGPNYGEIKDAQKTLEQNKEQIKQLYQIRTQLSNEGDQQQLTEQIRVLEQADQEIETLLDDAQKGFSLFGWLNKLIS